MNDATHAYDQFSDFEALESGVRYYCRQMPALFARAQNAQVWDNEGQEYIDFLSACGSLNYGHNHPALKAEVVSYLQSNGLINGLDLHTRAKRDFLRVFREGILWPRKLDYRLQFTGPTGTNAVEAALKLARKITGRRTVVAFTNAFHGMTLGAMSASGKSHGAVGGERAVRLPYDRYHGAGIDELDRFETMVLDPSGGVEKPAAFIVETVQAEGGLNVARIEWLRRLSRLARNMGALLIVDDIQAGCGRTGDFFSFERARIKPDLVCLSKSISGLGLPMSVLLLKPKHDIWSPGEHNGTFRGNNLAFVAATAAIRLWSDAEFSSNVAMVDKRVSEWVAGIVSRYGRHVVRRAGFGAMSGLRFNDKALASKIARDCFERRLLIETCGPHDDVLKLFPPLTIEADVLDKGLSRIARSIESTINRTHPLNDSVAA